MEALVFRPEQLIAYGEQQVRSRNLSCLLKIEQSLLIYAMAGGESISMERSEQVKLIQVLEGELAVQVAEKCYRLTVGEWLGIPLGARHGFQTTVGCKYLQIETEGVTEK